MADVIHGRRKRESDLPASCCGKFLRFCWGAFAPLGKEQQSWHAVPAAWERVISKSVSPPPFRAPSKFPKASHVFGFARVSRLSRATWTALDCPNYRENSSLIDFTTAHDHFFCAFISCCLMIISPPPHATKQQQQTQIKTKQKNPPKHEPHRISSVFFWGREESLLKAALSDAGRDKYWIPIWHCLLRPDRLGALAVSANLTLLVLSFLKVVDRWELN